MGFSDNLQYLRAQRNMTQSQLAMLLGVSRQAISKWESDKAYPEMDKLLIICDLFAVTLDDLVIGDVRESQRTPVYGSSLEGSSSETDVALQPPIQSRGPVIDSSALPQDLTGYDKHMKSFSARISGGIFAIIFGFACGNFFDDNNSILANGSPNGFFTFICISIGVICGLALIIPAGLNHASFMKHHPYIEDFYTEQDRSQGRRVLTIGLVSGIGLILIGLSIPMFVDDLLNIDEGWPNALFLLLVACGVFAIVYSGMFFGRLNIADYNKTEEHKKQPGNIYDTLTASICSVIMIIATIVGLIMLFVYNGGPRGLFWLSWVIGGLLCGLASVIIEAVRASHQRHDNVQV